jgi:hypothetical protein
VDSEGFTEKCETCKPLQTPGHNHGTGSVIYKMLYVTEEEMRWAHCSSLSEQPSHTSVELPLLPAKVTWAVSNVMIRHNIRPTLESHGRGTAVQFRPE